MAARRAARPRSGRRRANGPSPNRAQELEVLEEGSAVFKMVGPVLIPQSLEDAAQNVDTRLDFIKGKLEGVDKDIEAKEAEIQALQKEIMEANRAMAQAAAAGQAGAEA